MFILKIIECDKYLFATSIFIIPQQGNILLLHGAN